MTEDGLLDRIVDSLENPMSFNMEQIQQIFSLPSQKSSQMTTLDKPTCIANLILVLLRDIDSELLDEIMLDIFKIISDAKKRNR